MMMGRMMQLLLLAGRHDCLCQELTDNRIPDNAKAAALRGASAKGVAPAPPTV
jgi:hypothetical protein